MVTLDLGRHVLSGCPCGHAEHVGHRPVLAPLMPGYSRPSTSEVRCPACLEIESTIGMREGAEVRLVFLHKSRLVHQPLEAGMAAMVSKVPCRVVSVTPIAKLDGRLPTEFVAVAVRQV